MEAKRVVVHTALLSEDDFLELLGTVRRTKQIEGWLGILISVNEGSKEFERNGTRLITLSRIEVML